MSQAARVGPPGLSALHAESTKLRAAGLTITITGTAGLVLRWRDA